MNTMIKLMIFDLDDTLVHSNINYSEIRYQIADLFDPPLTSTIITKTPILKLLDQLKNIDPNKFTEGYRRVDHAEKIAARNAQVIEGAERIPKILNKYGIHSVIYTNNSKGTVEAYLVKPKFKFLRNFQIFTREDFIEPKPSPIGLNDIIKRYQGKQITKDNTVYIGDSYIDAIAADKAEIKFIWFNSRKIDQDLFPRSPYAILTDWSDFESIF
ncbi:MAG: HAD family hydrolase [Promethearchaeota archaeon]